MRIDVVNSIFIALFLFYVPLYFSCLNANITKASDQFDFIHDFIYVKTNFINDEPH